MKIKNFVIYSGQNWYAGQCKVFWKKRHIQPENKLMNIHQKINNDFIKQGQYICGNIKFNLN